MTNSELEVRAAATALANLVNKVSDAGEALVEALADAIIEMDREPSDKEDAAIQGFIRSQAEIQAVAKEWA